MTRAQKTLLIIASIFLLITLYFTLFPGYKVVKIMGEGYVSSINHIDDNVYFTRYGLPDSAIERKASFGIIDDKLQIRHQQIIVEQNIIEVHDKLQDSVLLETYSSNSYYLYNNAEGLRLISAPMEDCYLWDLHMPQNSNDLLFECHTGQVMSTNPYFDNSTLLKKLSTYTISNIHDTLMKDGELVGIIVSLRDSQNLLYFHESGSVVIDEGSFSSINSMFNQDGMIASVLRTELSRYGLQINGVDGKIASRITGFQSAEVFPEHRMVVYDDYSHFVIQRMDTTFGEVLCKVPIPWFSKATAFELSPDRKKLYVGFMNGNLYIYNIDI